MLSQLSLQEWSALSDSGTALSQIRVIAQQQYRSAHGSSENGQPLTAIPVAAPDYPRGLLAIPSPPPVLWCVGDLGVVERGQAFSLCGSRHASERGLRWANYFGEALGRRGHVLVTGMAQGIDRRAVDGALAAGGSVIGVLSEGIARFKQGAYASPIQEGRMLLVSEFRPKSRWTVGQAMQRNRTICLLGDGLFVIEAGTTGGTLAAGRTALKLGRPVFAIQYAGGNAGNEMLIKEGAFALCRTGDLLRVIDAGFQSHAPSSLQGELKFC